MILIYRYWSNQNLRLRALGSSAAHGAAPGAAGNIDMCIYICMFYR